MFEGGFEWRIPLGRVLMVGFVDRVPDRDSENDFFLVWHLKSIIRNSSIIEAFEKRREGGWLSIRCYSLVGNCLISLIIKVVAFLIG